MNKVSYNTIAIYKDCHCNDCGWPVIDAACNGTFFDWIKDTKGETWDWWAYCSNKSCKNHEGEGVFQNIPDWLVSKQ